MRDLPDSASAAIVVVSLLCVTTACSTARPSTAETPLAVRTSRASERAHLRPSVPGDLVSVTDWDPAEAIGPPEYVTARQADRLYGAADRVIGVTLNGESSAYPVAALSRRQVVNDTLGGVPIVISWSPLAYAATVHVRPEVDGRRLDFGSSGKLVRNASVLYDHQSTSLWNPITGEAILGALRSWSLEAVPAAFTTWAAWRRARPRTRAMARGDSGPDPNQSYYADGTVGRDGAFLADDRLPAKSMVVGAVIGETAAAWPLGALELDPVRNASAGGTALLIVYDPMSATALLYDRTLGDGRRLSFTATGAGLELVDQETGSHWDGWTGAAVSGPLEGSQLALLPSMPAFWFAWHDHFPDSLIPGSPARGAP